MFCLPNCFYRPQRSWAKVMFLQASVILSTGGCLPQCMLGYTPPGADTPPPGPDTPKEQTPPGADTHPPRARQTPPSRQSRHSSPRSSPPEQTPPLGSRHPPWADPPGADPPQEQTPPGTDTPPGKQTPAYGQRVAGMHPTGMHSC